MSIDKEEMSVDKKPLLPPTYLFISIIMIGILSISLPIKTVIPSPSNLIGLVPFLFGVILNLVASKAFKDNRTTVRPFHQSITLITTGVFRMTRNPMYLGFVCILFGTAILTGGLSPCIVPVLFAVIIDRAFIRVEERMLQKQFGKDWQDYKRQTRRWV